MNIVITVAGIIGIIASFVLLNSLVQFSTKLLAATWFQHHASKLDNARQNASVMLLVACITLCVVVIGVNGTLIFQGKSVFDFYLNLLASIPRQFWISFAIALFQCISLLLLVKLSLPYLLKALDESVYWLKIQTKLPLTMQVFKYSSVPSRRFQPMASGC